MRDCAADRRGCRAVYAAVTMVSMSLARATDEMDRVAVSKLISPKFNASFLRENWQRKRIQGSERQVPVAIFRLCWSRLREAASCVSNILYDFIIN